MLLIWKAFQNTEEWDWHFPLWNIFFRSGDINIFVLCKFGKWWYSVAPCSNEPRYNEQHLKAWQNYSKICGTKPRYNEMPAFYEIPAVTNRFWQSQCTIYLAITNILPYCSHSVKTTWWYKWLTSQTGLPIGQGRETLTFKALLHVNLAVHVQVCRLFSVVYIPLFSLVTPL